MALAQARTGQLNKAGFGLEVCNGCSTRIAHGRTQTADQLMQDRRDRALVRYLAFNPLRNQFQRIADVLLEVTISRAARHGTQRAHAAIGFVRPALVEENLARGFVGPSKQAAQHGDIGTTRNRFGQIARKLNPAIGDNRRAGCISGVDTIHNRG